MKYKSKVTAIDVVPDGYLMAAGYEDGHIVLWDPNSGGLLKNFDFTNPISALKFYSLQHSNFVCSDF